MNYIEIWRAKGMCDNLETLTEMADRLEVVAGLLREYAAAGITLQAPIEDDWGFMITDNPEVAAKYNFPEEESEEFSDDEPEGE